MTHTPGPWRVMPPDQAINAWIVADAEGGSVADCSPPGPWMSPVEADDNARLAAAAPEMLVALRAVLTVWHDATATRQDDEAAESAARAAIAKAEGCSDAPAHD